MKTIAKERQTLLDIALQTCGHIETVLALAEANGMSITDRLEDGRVLTVRNCWQEVTPGPLNCTGRIK